MKISAISKFVLSLTLAFSLVSFSYAKENKVEKTDKKVKSSVATFDASLYKLVNTNKVKLAIDKIPEASVNVILRDSRGNIVYQEVLKKNDGPYRRVFDVEGMEDGTYHFELYNKDNKIIKKLEIETSNNKEVVL
ncbi:hypothetical protein [Dyadobacter frigoris]|uniref:T9SS type A sorting domain-containing protein n=1 Tax=Dyadobacter frigoris TaxID=2576211 RepID=A0A4U6D7D1_9BACT|nr:hypothetical protein [Dyadobacter frigoris]TKT92038.1 hypothetical protein FDK13_12945 [Dyadobacter frigoris]GLU53081.1 hypothetical protein Dfri01_25420 [Dyadobacter frigoris]